MTKPDPSPFAWWRAEFPKAYIVKEIYILTSDWWNWATAADLYIDDCLCSRVPNPHEKGQWLEYKCGKDFGIIGSSVKVQKYIADSLMICGIKVFGIPYPLSFLDQ